VSEGASSGSEAHGSHANYRLQRSRGGNAAIYNSFQLHASSSVGAILVIAQWGAGQGEYKIRPYARFRSHPSEIRYS
jgi:hypothetical protein